MSEGSFRMGEMGRCFCPPLLLAGRAGAQALVADIEQLRRWLRQARHGDHIIYARGVWLGGIAEAEPLLTAVRLAAEDALLRCHQRRLPPPPEGPGGYDYLAYRTRVPLAPVMARRAGAPWYPTRAAAARASAEALFRASGGEGGR